MKNVHTVSRNEKYQKHKNAFSDIAQRTLHAKVNVPSTNDKSQLKRVDHISWSC